MDLRLYTKGKIRVITHHTKENFIDVFSMNDEYGIRVSNWSDQCQYMELREKDNMTAMFFFMQKSHKKLVDFGWWEDADLVWSKNKVKLK